MASNLEKRVLHLLWKLNLAFVVSKGIIQSLNNRCRYSLVDQMLYVVEMQSYTMDAHKNILRFHTFY